MAQQGEELRTLLGGAHAAATPVRIGATGALVVVGPVVVVVVLGPVVAVLCAPGTRRVLPLPFSASPV